MRVFIRENKKTRQKGGGIARDPNLFFSGERN